MKSIKCSKCGMVNFATEIDCKRCKMPLSEARNTEKSEARRNTPHLTNSVDTSPEELKKDSWKMITWGSIISAVGFAITIVAISFGVFTGYSNTEGAYLTKAKFFSLLTLLPLAVILIGVIQLTTGISIDTIIRKWEELPEWLGWIVGISVFLLILFIILFIAAVIIFNFF